ncbi:TPA: 50S ribosomal protein L17 [bacterium UBP9_UBA11836]|nr:50S ribosomal protein L17 [bacterium UBP9_UBA11836]
MRHKVRSRTLGRQTGHRFAMLRNLATSLLRHEQITTTITRAREVARFTDELISWARKAKNASDAAEALAYKRRVFRQISDRAVAQDLFENLAVRFSDRHGENKCGGYTRVIHNGFRKGDGAPMAVIELVR